jgi:hypothetical protein
MFQEQWVYLHYRGCGQRRAIVKFSKAMIDTGTVVPYINLVDRAHKRGMKSRGRMEIVLSYHSTLLTNSKDSLVRCQNGIQPYLSRRKHYNGVPHSLSNCSSTHTVSVQSMPMFSHCRYPAPHQHPSPILHPQ